MNFKLLTGAGLLAAALVFSLQNAGEVEVQLLAWTFSTSLALVVFGTLVTGLIGGWAIASTLHRGKHRSGKSDSRSMPAGGSGHGE